jgi:hypothetical protein
MQKLIITVKDEDELRAELLKQSLSGGAWVATVMPFSHEAHLYCYKTPSRVPDDFMSSTPSRERGIAWQGKFQPYSAAALQREQQRGYSGDR